MAREAHLLVLSGMALVIKKQSRQFVVFTVGKNIVSCHAHCFVYI